MLNRRLAVLVKTVLVIAVVAAPLSTVRAVLADDVELICPPNGDQCWVRATTPGSPGREGGGGNAECDPDLGCPTDVYGCYIKLAEPQPDRSDKIWQGHTDGAIYLRTCYSNPEPFVTVAFGTLLWLPAAPGTPAVLAAQAINQLGIRGPQVGIAPDPAGSGLVGLPVWLWTVVGPQTWGPISATAAVPGVSVTATARAQRIVWNMGDGHSVSCDNPGTPYLAEYGDAMSPTCGYRYLVESDDQPGGRFTVTATTTWQVDWAGGGESGTVTVTRASTTTVEINELKVVTS
jgi:hypothetical protein